MSMTDPISDLLTRIRNANQEKHETVEIPASRLKANIVRVLKEEGYIRDCNKVAEEGKTYLVIELKYYMGSPVISNIKRASRPGLRLYRGKTDLPTVHNGLGIAVVSTPKGLMTDRAARATGHGGEILCYVY